MAGFECSSHRRRDGQRLGLLRVTGHDSWARSDYHQVAGLGLRAAREIIEEGSPAELRRRGNFYQQMWRLQSEGLSLRQAS
jgi:hypothetical protein